MSWNEISVVPANLIKTKVNGRRLCQFYGLIAALTYLLLSSVFVHCIVHCIIGDLKVNVVKKCQLRLRIDPSIEWSSHFKVLLSRLMYRKFGNAKPGNGESLRVDQQTLLQSCLLSKTLKQIATLKLQKIEKNIYMT